VFRRVGEAALRHLGVPPSGSGEALERMADEARARLAAARAASPTIEESTAEATPNEDGGPSLDPREPGEDEARVPALLDRNLRAALVALDAAGLVAEVVGEGRVTEVAPPPGEIVPLGSTVHLVLGRPSARPEDVEFDEPAEVTP
jgi:hypothetical protein